MLILETERLLLREFVPEDVDALAAVLSDPETMRYYPAVLDRAGVAAWIDRNRRRYADAGHGLWAMILKSNGEVIGDCGLTRQTVDDVDEIEIGYHVRRDLWGQGYAPEAARACRDYGFERLGAREAHFADPAGESSVAPCGGENWIESVEGSDVEGLAALRIRSTQRMNRCGAGALARGP